MRLTQFSDKVAEAAKTKQPKTLDPETRIALESIMLDMHKTMLTADTLMRKLEQILEK